MKYFQPVLKYTCWNPRAWSDLEGANGATAESRYWSKKTVSVNGSMHRTQGGIVPFIRKWVRIADIGALAAEKDQFRLVRQIFDWIRPE